MIKSECPIFDEAWKDRRFVRGMTKDEINTMLRKLKIKRKDYWKNCIGDTCAVDEKTNEVLYYWVDIERYLAICLKYRQVGMYEWD